MPLTPGQKVNLIPYTTEQCPVCPWNPAIGPIAVGEKYTVLGTTVIPYDGKNYSVLQLERTVATDPGPGLSWPEFATSLVLGGGIS
jgi:hypothetical protein